MAIVDNLLPKVNDLFLITLPMKGCFLPMTLKKRYPRFIGTAGKDRIFASFKESKANYFYKYLVFLWQIPLIRHLVCS